MQKAYDLRLNQGHIKTVLLAIILLILGLMLRVLLADPAALGGQLTNLFPWLRETPITLYFSDGEVLVPVSTVLEEASPSAVAAALGNDPALELHIEGGRVTVILPPDYLAAMPPQALIALEWSLLSLPKVEQVTFLHGEIPLETSAAFVPLFLLEGDRLVAVPVVAENPRAALEAYLSLPGEAGFVGLPEDADLLSYNYTPQNGLIALSFRYTSALKQFAVEEPEALSQVLTGLIATMTRFPEVKAVTLDFEGRTQLGLGQCANLLRAPQTFPTTLNLHRAAR